MALIICPECGQKISSTLKRCIHCGFKIKTNIVTGQASARQDEPKPAGLSQPGMSDASVEPTKSDNLGSQELPKTVITLPRTGTASNNPSFLETHGLGNSVTLRIYSNRNLTLTLGFILVLVVGLLVALYEGSRYAQAQRMAANPEQSLTSEPISSPDENRPTSIVQTAPSDGIYGMWGRALDNYNSGSGAPSEALFLDVYVQDQETHAVFVDDYYSSIVVSWATISTNGQNVELTWDDGSVTHGSFTGLTLEFDCRNHVPIDQTVLSAGGGCKFQKDAPERNGATIPASGIMQASLQQSNGNGTPTGVSLQIADPVLSPDGYPLYSANIIAADGEVLSMFSLVDLGTGLIMAQFSNGNSLAWATAEPPNHGGGSSIYMDCSRDSNAPYGPPEANSPDLNCFFYDLGGQ